MGGACILAPCGVAVLAGQWFLSDAKMGSRKRKKKKATKWVCTKVRSILYCNTQYELEQQT